VSAAKPFLLSCPFCDGAAVFARIISPEGERRGEAPSYDIHCDDCWVWGRWDDADKAVEAWNGRTPAEAASSSDRLALPRDDLSNLRDETARIVERLKGWPHHPAGADYSVASISALMAEAADQIQALYVGLGRGSSPAESTGAGPAACAASETVEQSEVEALRLALITARGWVVTCSGSATARRDLKQINAALAWKNQP
jgi:hypothetical protein